VALAFGTDDRPGRRGRPRRRESRRDRPRPRRRRRDDDPVPADRSLGPPGARGTGRDGTVYAGGGTTVEAFALATGERRWRTAAGVAPEVVAGEAAVYLRSHGSLIVALAHEDGRVLWERDGVAARRSPAVAGEYLFVGDADGGVRALGPEPERPGDRVTE